jgi:diguanylate cyclase (GGDEF)-like protein
MARATQGLRRGSDPLVSMSVDNAQASGKSDRGQPLVVEVAIPVALGLLVLVAALGLVVASVDRADGLMRFAAVPVAVGLTAAIGAWIAWILRDAALNALQALHRGLQGLEQGDFAARIPPTGAREFREVADTFNRTVAFLGHQRDRLKELASTDPMTGLANHRSLHEQLRTEMERVVPSGGSLGVVAVDLDGFRQINEERGHARGDETLKAVAKALSGSVREGDLVARLGGDDFVLVLRDVDSAHVRHLADRARDAITRSVPDDIRLAVSAGYVCYPSQTGPEADLVELAGAALRVAKREGGSRTQKYDPDQVTALPTLRAERLEIEALLEQAEPVVPVFQPIVELRSGRLVGYEALARFPGQDNRTPDAFFNQAARVGRGAQLEAVALAAALKAPHRPPGTYLSLNCTPSAISSSIVRASLPADLKDVVIEITEHELAPQDGALEAGLAELRGRGARIAIDDAGAGYAGLQQIMRVQPDIIKLDRSLVESVDVDGAKAALIEFFIVFARRINADVCTEGIETPGELGALAALGVSLGQGYLLGRPATPWSPIAPAAVSAIGQVQQQGLIPGVAGASSGPVNRRLNRTGRR